MAEAEDHKQVRKPSRFGRHPHSGYTTQASIWIEKDGELYLGGGRIMLLERIDKLGSIAAAARSMGLTYSNAWHWIDSMNTLAPSPLVLRITGGVGGGSAKITEAGYKAIDQYHKLRTKLERVLKPESLSFDSPDQQFGHNAISSKRKPLRKNK
jgi:molybdate transport system regulatory protein